MSRKSVSRVIFSYILLPVLLLLLSLFWIEFTREVGRITSTTLGELLNITTAQTEIKARHHLSKSHRTKKERAKSRSSRSTTASKFALAFAGTMNREPMPNTATRLMENEFVDLIESKRPELESKQFIDELFWSIVWVLRRVRQDESRPEFWWLNIDGLESDARVLINLNFKTASQIYKLVDQVVQSYDDSGMWDSDNTKYDPMNSSNMYISTLEQRDPNSAKIGRSLAARIQAIHYASLMRPRMEKQRKRLAWQRKLMAHAVAQYTRQTWMLEFGNNALLWLQTLKAKREGSNWIRGLESIPDDRRDSFYEKLHNHFDKLLQQGLGKVERERKILSLKHERVVALSAKLHDVLHDMETQLSVSA